VSSDRTGRSCCTGLACGYALALLAHTPTGGSYSLVCTTNAALAHKRPSCPFADPLVLLSVPGVRALENEGQALLEPELDDHASWRRASLTTGKKGKAPYSRPWLEGTLKRKVLGDLTCIGMCGIGEKHQTMTVLRMGRAHHRHSNVRCCSLRCLPCRGLHLQTCQTCCLPWAKRRWKRLCDSSLRQHGEWTWRLRGGSRLAARERGRQARCDTNTRGRRKSGRRGATSLARRGRT
jgi:hypothetical protein